MRKRPWRFLLLAILLLLAAGLFEWTTAFVRVRLARAEGRRCVQQEDYAGAIRAYDRALALWPNHAELFWDRAEAKYQQGDEDGAFADGEQAAQLDPREPAYRITTASRSDARGLKRMEAANLDGAIADFQRARQLAPKKDEYRNHLAAAHGRRANLHHQASRTDDAIADYLAGLKLEPTDLSTLTQAATLLSGRGMGRSGQGDTHGAIADYSRALDLIALLAGVVKQAGDDPKTPGKVGVSLPAGLDVAKVIDLAGSLYGLRATAHGKQGDWEAAEADFTRAIDSGFHSPGIYRERGLARLRRQRPAEAQQDFDVFLRAHPEGRAVLETELAKIRAQP